MGPPHNVCYCFRLWKSPMFIFYVAVGNRCQPSSRCLISMITTVPRMIRPVPDPTRLWLCQLLSLAITMVRVWAEKKIRCSGKRQKKSNFHCFSKNSKTFSKNFRCFLENGGIQKKICICNQRDPEHVYFSNIFQPLIWIDIPKVVWRFGIICFRAWMG